MAGCSGVEESARALDAHFREILRWHFSPETGCPFWLNWAASRHWNPAEEITSFSQIDRFPNFEDAWLRDEPNESWISRAFTGRPYKVFETGGTTGLPKQRLSWEDHLIDYEEFSEHLDEEAFPRGANWLMLGPTGPRRLRISIEHLANSRGGSCYFVDFDARWVKKLLSEHNYEQANAYKDHVTSQAVALLEKGKFGCLFTTPKLLEALGERISLPATGLKGVFCGGTQMTPQMVRFLVEEVLEGVIAFLPTYGNTLMGLARSRLLRAHDEYSVTYYAPQPRAVLRVVDKEEVCRLVPYGHCGRVELTTMTKEFFMPRFLERDQAIRRRPVPGFAWDGVGEVQPLDTLGTAVVEGVY